MEIRQKFQDCTTALLINSSGNTDTVYIYVYLWIYFLLKIVAFIYDAVFCLFRTRRCYIISWPRGGATDRNMLFTLHLSAAVWRSPVIFVSSLRQSHSFEQPTVYKDIYYKFRNYHFK